MRKIIAFIIASIFLLSSSTSVMAATTESSYLTETIEEAVAMANTEIGYEYFDINEINKDTWEKYKSLFLLYGSPHGDKKDEEYRYLGYTPENEPFTNIFFPHDAWAGGYLDDREWIEAPWKEDSAPRSPFNNNPEYETNIENGLELYYKEFFKGTKKDWYKCVQIMQPCTDNNIGMGRMWHKTGGSVWYITIPIVPDFLAGEIEHIVLKDYTHIEFTVNHYVEGTEDEVYQSEYISKFVTDPLPPQQVYSKTGIGLDGNEWICTTTSPQTVDIVDGGEYNYYYTKKEKAPAEGEGQLILTKDPLVTANCKMAGRKNVPDTKGGKYPDGLPLFRGDTFKPNGSIKNPESRSVYLEYSMTLKDKPDKNFRQVNHKSWDGVLFAGNTKTDSFSRKITNSDRYGNVYVLTVEARQRIIVPEPPPKPGSKPKKSDYVGSRPRRSDYDSYSEYRDARDEYYDDLEDYYDDLEDWYEEKEIWDEYVDTWGNPSSGEVFKYKGYWVSDKYGWRTGKGEDMNYVMPNVRTNIEDMDGGLKDSVITE